MQNLAFLSQKLGMSVSGSDRENSDTIGYLQSKSIEAYVGADCRVVDRADLVVFSSAVGQDDIERVYAQNSGKIVIERKTYLGLLSQLFDRVVSVAGSHGKSTMSAMIAYVIGRLGGDVTTHLGCKPVGWNGFLYSDKRDILVCEACEYRRSFLELDSYIGVITGIDYDHPDTYPSKKDLCQAFATFGQKSNILIGSEQAKSILKMPCISYGFSRQNDYFAENIKENHGKYSCAVCHQGERVDLNLGLYGKHNLLNALGAVAVCNTLGYDMTSIVEVLADFGGIERRFECKGKMPSGARVIIDYAHHPTEIAAAISTANRLGRGKVWTVFQPHTYSRTASLLNEFACSFYWSDEIILLPTFSARESENDGKNSFDLYHKLLEKGQVCVYAENREEVAKSLKKMTSKEDIVLVLGAGDVNKLADMLVEN